MGKTDKIFEAAAGAPDPASELMLRLAGRVRELRKLKKMPRRRLSEISGVSPRYLAQLEAGAGNISIILLQRVATALDVRAEDLITDRQPLASDALQIASLYQSSPQPTQMAVRRILIEKSESSSRAGRICLVGLRGAGKSTLGRMVSHALNLPFVELTAEIEKHSEMPVPEILALYGPDGYRRLEAEVLRDITTAYDKLVLAAAGGIVSNPDTYGYVLKEFHTVWLHATPGEHMERVRSQGDMRPMAGNPKAMAQLRDLLQERSDDYAKAEAQLDTSNRSEATSLNDLLGVIAAHGFLEE